MLELPHSEQFYDARSAFVDRYAAGKSWDAQCLTWEQIQEIRSQPEWDDPPAVDEEPRSVIRRDGPNLFIYEEGEFCCVCESTERLSRIGLGDPEQPMEFTICNPCFSGGRFHDWLCGEFERAMIVHDENRKLSDGRWTTATYGDR